MGIDHEQTGDIVKSDQTDVGPEGDARETPSDAEPAVAREAGAAPGAGALKASVDSDPTLKPAQQDAEGDTTKKKKGKKKDTGIGTSRGIETMFRTSYRVHQDLVGLADTKANIMISVNGFIIAITIPFVTSQMVGPIAGASWYEWLPPLATGILLIGCVTALVYAVLAARPRVSNVPLTLEDIARNDANILFFGNFVNLSEAEFVEGMRDLMQTQDHLYVNMVRDLYGLGQVLKTKFRLLRISYTVFMFALVVGVGLFVLGFALDATMAPDLLEQQGALPLLPS